MLARQSVLLAGTWVVSGAISVLLNLDGGTGIVVRDRFRRRPGRVRRDGHRPSADA